MTPLIETITLFSFVSGCFVWIKKEIEVDIKLLQEEQPKTKELIKKLVLKTTQQDEMLETISSNLNRIDLYLVSNSLEYGRKKAETPIIDD